MALTKSMPLLTKMSAIHLEQTNLSDEGFSLILKCIHKEIQSFKSIKYIGGNSSFGPKSFEWFQKIFLRQVPFQV